jgi:hypothetical protein
LLRAAEAFGDLPVGTLLHDPQGQDLALPFRQTADRAQGRRGQGEPLLDRLEAVVWRERRWQTELASGFRLNRDLVKRLAQDVPGDTEQPGACRATAVVTEAPPGKPGAGKDLGGQIGGMLADPRSSPGVDLRDVAVVELREGFGVVCPEKLGVRLSVRVASHICYMTPAREVCHRRDSAGATPKTYSHAVPAMQEEAAVLIAGLVFAGE